MTGVPPAARTTSRVFQYTRVSCTTFSGQQAHAVIPLDKVALAVIKEAAVKVAVPGQAQVGPGLMHGGGGGGAAFRQQGVGHAVGKGSVRLHLTADKVAGQGGGQLPQDQPGAAVARVGHDFERSAGARRRLRRAAVVQQPAHIGGPVRNGVQGRIQGRSLGRSLGRSQGRRLRGGGPVGVLRCRQQPGYPVAQGQQAGISAYRHGPGAHDFKAVFVRRVVAAGDHDARVVGLMGGGIVDFLRAAEPQVRHPGPSFAQACGQSVAQ